MEKQTSVSGIPLRRNDRHVGQLRDVIDDVIGWLEIVRKSPTANYPRYRCCSIKLDETKRESHEPRLEIQLGSAQQITLMRHGRSRADDETVHEGRYDSPLTNVGKAQVHSRAEEWRRGVATPLLSVVAAGGGG